MFFFFQAEDGIRDSSVTGVQTCALPILLMVRVPGNFRVPGLIWRVLARCVLWLITRKSCAAWIARDGLLCAAVVRGRWRAPKRLTIAATRGRTCCDKACSGQRCLIQLLLILCCSQISAMLSI